MKYNRGTEINLNDFDTLNVTVGVIDKNNPRTFYIKLTAWGNPIDYSELNNYKSIIRGLNKKIRTTLFNNLNTTLINNKHTLVDLDIRESGIVNNKSSFMNCEITLNQVNYYLIDSKEIFDEINLICNVLLKEVFKNDKHFKFFKKKKSANESLFKA